VNKTSLGPVLLFLPKAPNSPNVTYSVTLEAFSPKTLLEKNKTKTKTKNRRRKKKLVDVFNKPSNIPE